MTLQELRKKIDAIDSKLVKLLNDRTKLVLKIGEIKEKQGVEIYAPHREDEVFRRILSQNAGPITGESLMAIYREIMSSSLSLEKSLTIAYLGPEATYTHQAAIKKFGSSLKYAPQPTITDVFAEVSRKNADYGVVPIENSTEGAVYHTLDMFADSDLKICAQILLPISHNLLARCPLQQVQRVYSNPQAIGQCRKWLQTNLPKADLIEVSSTTRAAEIAKTEVGAGAIAGALAAKVYQLDMVGENIQDLQGNTTRFLVLGRKHSAPTGNDKTSIMFSVQDKVGALVHALEPFQHHKLNLSKIESRPSKRKAWEYYFFVDFHGHCEDSKVKKALEELSKYCSFVKILGSYPNGL